MITGYLIVIIGGVMVGFAVPRQSRTGVKLVSAALIFLALVAFFAVLSGYRSSNIVNLLTLAINPMDDYSGLSQLTAVAYACLVGASVVGLRTALGGTSANAEKPHDI
jgi:hypothetical protein